MPIFYECDRCTACCRWPGQVRLSDAEISRLANFLEMSEFDFVQRHTRLTADRQGLALEEKLNGECIFLEGSDCSVNAVKPQQCRDFPNLWNFPGFQEVCRAKAVVMDDVGYTKAIEKATGRNEKNGVSKCR
jgi:Fe-S-cluster containining protein